MTGETIDKKLVSVFNTKGKVLIKNIPANMGNIARLKEKYKSNDEILFYHVIPLNDRKFPIYNPDKNKKLS